MAISGKVTLDLSQRTVGRLGLLWNRFPTCGAKAVSSQIATASRQGPVTVSVSREQLSIRIGNQEMPIYKSEAYARCLYEAGVMNVGIGEPAQPKEIKRVLDVLIGNVPLNVLRVLNRNFQFSPLTDISKIILELTRKKVVDSPEIGHSESWQIDAYTGERYTGPAYANYSSCGSDWIIDKPEESHFEFLAEGIIKVERYLPTCTQEFRQSVIDEIANTDIELAILLVEKISNKVSQSSLLIKLLQIPGIQAPIVARILLNEEVIPRNVRIDTPEEGHFEGSPPYDFYNGPEYYVDQEAGCYWEFSPGDINKAWSYLQIYTPELQKAVIDEIAKRDPKYADLLAAKMKE